MAHVILVILIIIPGVCGEDWVVVLNNQCGLRGSSVVIPCSYDYPWGLFVTSIFWSRGEYIENKWKLSHLSLTGRFEYLGNKEHDCTLKINNLEDSDEGTYFFGFATTLSSSWSPSYAYLSIKDLTTVVKPSTVTEGEKVRLTCMLDCTPSSLPGVVWFRDAEPVTNQEFQARIKDAGSYYCAVKGQEAIRSAPVTLDVQYSPKNVTLSVSPSADVIKGSTVTFTCSSDANPAVNNSGYTLLHTHGFTASGQIHNISDIQPSHSGQYYCQASNGIEWRGIGFPKSEVINIDVQYLPENTSVSISGDSPEHLVEGSSVNLTCSSDANPPVHNYTWYKRTGPPGSSSLVQVGSGQVLVLTSLQSSQSGLYFCQTRNSLGGNNSTEMPLEIQQGNHSLHVLAGVGVTLLVALVVAFGILVLCKKLKTPANKQSESGSATSGTELQQEDSNVVYANVHHSLSSCPSQGSTVVYSTVQRGHHCGHVGKVSTTRGTEEVLYSIVTIQTKDKGHIYTTQTAALVFKTNTLSSAVRDKKLIL